MSPSRWSSAIEILRRRSERVAEDDRLVPTPRSPRRAGQQDEAAPPRVAAAVHEAIRRALGRHTPVPRG